MTVSVAEGYIVCNVAGDLESLMKYAKESNLLYTKSFIQPFLLFDTQEWVDLLMLGARATIYLFFTLLRDHTQ